jgi:nitrite reductase/ring-hydroxylating ferredoxin subunit
MNRPALLARMSCQVETATAGLDDGEFSMATPMERAPDPGLDYRPIPKERYTGRDFAMLEWEHMWTKTWLCAGRASDAPHVGDYFTFEIGPESILVIRQQDGSLAARYNVCMHRGNRLREPGRGHAEKFSCLFHGWEYGIDGGLIKALDRDCFPQGVDPKKLSLQPGSNRGVASRLPGGRSGTSGSLPFRRLESQLRLYDRDRM